MTLKRQRLIAMFSLRRVRTMQIDNSTTKAPGTTLRCFFRPLRQTLTKPSNRRRTNGITRRIVRRHTNTSIRRSRFTIAARTRVIRLLSQQFNLALPNTRNTRIINTSRVLHDFNRTLSIRQTIVPNSFFIRIHQTSLVIMSRMTVTTNSNFRPHIRVHERSLNPASTSIIQRVSINTRSPNFRQTLSLNIRVRRLPTNIRTHVNPPNTVRQRQQVNSFKRNIFRNFLRNRRAKDLPLPTTVAQTFMLSTRHSTMGAIDHRFNNQVVCVYRKIATY